MADVCPKVQMICSGEISRAISSATVKRTFLHFQEESISSDDETCEAVPHFKKGDSVDEGNSLRHPIYQLSTA